MKRILLMVVLTFSLVATVNASVTTLFKFSSGTFVTSEHADNYFADTYIGTAAVRGTDKIYNGSYHPPGIYYFTWTRVTYNVQGDFSSTTAYSSGPTDNVSRKSQITVKDKWNFGSKTEVYWNRGLKYLSGEAPLKLTE